METILTAVYNSRTSSELRFVSTVRPWLVLAAGLSGVLLMGSLLLCRSHDSITAEQRDRLETQALVLAENMDRQLHSIDSALRAVRKDLGAVNGEPTSISPRQLKTLSEVVPGVKGVLATDAAGTVIMSERTALRGQTFQHREYFSVPRDRPDFSTLYVSSPFVTTQGNYSINLTKAMADTQGRFRGIVTANLDSSYFEMLARATLYASDMRVSLVHGNGKIFVDARHATDLLGSDIGLQGSLFSQHVASERDESVMRGNDSTGATNSMVVYRTIMPSDLSMDTPLVIAVSREIDAIYAGWWKDVRNYGLLFVLLCIGSAIALRQIQLRSAAAWQAAQEKDALAFDAAQQLTAAAELQKRTGELARVGGWQLEMATMEMTWTDAMFVLHELPATSPPSLEQCLASYTPDTRPSLEAAIRQAMEHGTPWSVQACLVTAKGRKLWIRTQGEAVLHGGKVVRLTGASQDVTERVQYAAKLAAANKQLEQLAVTDSLTGVGNRRCFDQHLQNEWSRGQRSNMPLGLLMLDIDHFKLYNDKYGHLGGDDVLMRVASILDDCAQRSGELVARYGGEEFVILLPGSDLAQTRKMAQEIIAQLAHARIPHGASPTAPFVTASIGVASTVPVAAVDASRLVQTADIALYAAKTRGRNRAEQALFTTDEA